MTRIIYTSTASKKRKRKTKSKRREEAEAEHKRWLAKQGIKPVSHRTRPKPGIVDFPDLDTTRAGVAVLSNQIPAGVTPKRDILHDHKWKRGQQESQKTIAAIKNYAANVGPAYNKGGLVLQTQPPTDYKKQ